MGSFLRVAGLAYSIFVISIRDTRHKNMISSFDVGSNPWEQDADEQTANKDVRTLRLSG